MTFLQKLMLMGLLQNNAKIIFTRGVGFLRIIAPNDSRQMAAQARIWNYCFTELTYMQASCPAGCLLDKNKNPSRHQDLGLAQKNRFMFFSFYLF